MEPAPATAPDFPVAPPLDATAAPAPWLPLVRWLRALPHARIAIVALAAVLRLWMLDLRPPHFDEGVNGWFTDRMREIGCYQYDPGNYHGPLHFYILFVFKTLLGRNLWALRLPVALAGILTVDWIFRFQRFFGLRVCVWTALAMAISPGFVFFHRYAIHETWLVFFMILGFWGLIGLRTEGERRYLWAVGMGLTGMILTKETYLIHLICLLAAIPCVLTLEGDLTEQWSGILRRDKNAPPADDVPIEDPVPPRTSPWRLSDEPAPQLWSWRDLAAVVAVGLALILFFYSGNGFYWKGLQGLVTTFTPWAQKAKEGEGHNKPFYYWFGVLLRNEPWVFAGMVFAVRRAFQPGDFGWPIRLLAIYALGTFAAYSIIPYKTPWCVVSFAWPMLFLTAVEISDAAKAEKAEKAEGKLLMWLSAITNFGLLVYAALLALGWPLRALARHTPKELRLDGRLLDAPPLLLVGLALAFLLMAAVSCARQKINLRLACAAGGILLGCSAFLSVRLNFYRYTDENENYVYVHTLDQVEEIIGPLYDLVREDPVNYHRRGLVLLNSTHPLPWLLGDFTHIGYYGDGRAPQSYHADFLIVAEAREFEAEAGLDEDYFKETFRLRPSLDPVILYLRHSVFKHLMPEREPEFRKDKALPVGPQSKLSRDSAIKPTSAPSPSASATQAAVSP